MTSPSSALSPRPPAPRSRRARRQPNYADLTPADCQVLLESRNIGRIGWIAGSGPQIFPVSYAYTEDQLFFRTSPLGVLSELVRPTHVVFEVDDLDLTRHVGWSVIVHGQARAVAPPARLGLRRRVDGADPWAAGTRSLFIGITAERVTGRSFSAPWTT